MLMQELGKLTSYLVELMIVMSILNVLLNVVVPSRPAVKHKKKKNIKLLYILYESKKMQELQSRVLG